MTAFRRHDVLQISSAGRKHALAMATRYNPSADETLLHHVISNNTPAIVKAQENPRDGFLEVGFSSHLLKGGARVRLKSEIPLNEITHVITPFDLIVRASGCKHEPIRKALEDISRLATGHGLNVGVYGSCALELLTGMPYILPTSDIDIIVKCRNTYANISGFFDASVLVSQRYGTRFDIEVLCHDGSGVKLAELLCEGKTVICKRLYHGAKLRLKKNVVLASKG